MEKSFFKGKVLLTITLVFVVCWFVSTSSFAAKKVPITSANAKGFIGMINNGTPMGPVFGLSADDGYKLIRQRTDFNGVTHYR